MRRLTVAGWMLSLLVGLGLLAGGTAQAAATARSSFWVPRIAVVWPHDGAGQPAPVDSAPLVNVSVWPAAEVHCFLPPDGLTLFLASGNDPAAPVEQVPSLTLRESGGHFFPTLEYNDIPVTRNEQGQVEMRFYVQQWASYSNVWVHAEDGRTFKPAPRTIFAGEPVPQPSIFVQAVRAENADGDLVPVDQASQVSLDVEVIATDGRGEPQPVAGVDIDGSNGVAQAGPPLFLQLLSADGNAPLIRRTGIRPVLSVVQRNAPTSEAAQRVGLFTFPHVPVADGVATHFLIDSGRAALPSAIWSHGAEARTFMPEAAVPPQCFVPRGDG